MTSNEINSNFALLELGIKQTMELHPGTLSRTDLCLLKQIKDYVKDLENQNKELMEAIING